MNIRHLSVEELFHLRGPTGLEEISDDTMRQRLNEAELRQLRAAAPAYPDLVEHPEVM